MTVVLVADEAIYYNTVYVTLFHLLIMPAYYMYAVKLQQG